MATMDTIRARHSVCEYTSKPIKGTTVEQPDMGIIRCNFELAANELGADWRWE